MNDPIEPSQSPDHAAGFAMPLVLLVLAVLSFTAAVSLSALKTEQEFQLYRLSAVESAYAIESVREEIIWRALLETYGKESGEFTTDGVDRYRAKTPDGPWNRSGESLLWTGVYSDHPLPIGGVVVRVQDTVGLLDLNHANSNYVNFLADTLGVDASAKSGAVRSLGQKVDLLKSSRITSDEQFRTGLKLGLSSSIELCGLRGWTDIELCADGAPELSEVVVAGNGGLTNIRFAPERVRSLVFGHAKAISLSEEQLSWREVQQKWGFYDPLINSSPGGLVYIVRVEDRRSGEQHVFELDLSPISLSEPFKVSNAIIRSAEDSENENDFAVPDRSRN